MDSSDRLLVADGPPTARSPRARTERASLDNWPFDPSVALLQPIDHTRMIRPDDVAELVERAITEGRRAVRTSALFPGSAASVMAHGFEAIDHLVLMRRTLDSLPSGLEVEEPSALSVISFSHVYYSLKLLA